MSTLTEVYAHLNRYQCYSSLRSLGLYSSCFDYSYEAPLRRFRTLTELSDFVVWANSEFDSQELRLGLAWNLYRLARFILLSGSADFKKVVLTTNRRSLVAPYNLVSGLFDPDGERPLLAGDGPHWAYRTLQAQYWLQEFPGHLLARNHLMFNRILQSSILAERVNNVFDSAYGMSMAEWSMTLFALSKLSPGAVLPEKVPQLGNLLGPERVRKVCESLSQTKLEYMQSVRSIERPYESVPERDLYGFEPLLLRPFIRPEARFIQEESYIAPNNQALIYKASNGLFYEIAELSESHDGPQASHQFRTDFGEIVLRQYFQEYFKYYGLTECVIDLDDAHNDVTRPDFAIVVDQNCLLIEVKLSTLTVDSRHLGDRQYVRKKLRREESLRRGIEQLTNYADRALAGDAHLLPRVKNVYCLLVSYDLPFLANAHLLQVVKEELGVEVAARVQFASLPDLEALLVYLSRNMPVLKVLERKFIRDFSYQSEALWTLRDFLDTQFRGSWEPDGLQEEMKKEYLDSWKDTLPATSED